MLRCFCYFKPEFATSETAKINTLTPSSRTILPLSQSGCNWAGRELYRCFYETRAENAHFWLGTVRKIITICH